MAAILGNQGTCKLHPVFMMAQDDPGISGDGERSSSQIVPTFPPRGGWELEHLLWGVVPK